MTRRDAPLWLDLPPSLGEAMRAMKTPLLSATAVALLALTACQSETKTTENKTVANPTTVARKPVVLPPSIKSEADYRCHGDNSLVHVILFADDRTAAVQSPPDAPPVSLAAPAAGQAMTAEGGWSLTGNARTIKLTQPGKAAMTCDK